MIFMSLVSSGCSARKIGGVTVEQAFPDPSIASLADAACKGNASRVRSLIASGLQADSPGKDDGRPLLWAMECHSKNGVQVLLENGANPNYSYGGHGSATWIAAGEPDVEMLQLLLSRGGDINRRYSDDSPLMRALVLGADAGYWKNYYLLLNAGADINQTGQLNRTVAEYAVTLGQMDKIEELLKRGYSHNLKYLMNLLLAVNLDEKHDLARRRLIQVLRERGAGQDAGSNNSFKPKPLRGSA
jgi:ankyrin repeat protein